jgi:hypothetical protein
MASSGERPAGDAGIAHVSIALPEGVEVGATNLLPIAITRDGTRIAFVGVRDGRNQIFVRALSEPEAKALDGTEGGDGPFFSPDGRWVAFFAGGKLRKIAVGGAALQDARRRALSPRGRLEHRTATSTSRRRTWAGSGACPRVEARRPRSPSGSPSAARSAIAGRTSVAGTHTLLYGVWNGPGDDEHTVAMQTIGESERHVLGDGGGCARATRNRAGSSTRVSAISSPCPWSPSKKDRGGGGAAGLEGTPQRCHRQRGLRQTTRYPRTAVWCISRAGRDAAAPGWYGSIAPARCNPWARPSARSRTS